MQQEGENIMNDEERVNIRFDRFIKSCENAWLVKIDLQQCYFPYSLCEIDEKSKVVLCPLWLAVKKKLENYIDE
jgi:hypothetical protein